MGQDKGGPGYVTVQGWCVGGFEAAAAEYYMHGKPAAGDKTRDMKAFRFEDLLLFCFLLL